MHPKSCVIDCWMSSYDESLVLACDCSAMFPILYGGSASHCHSPSNIVRLQPSPSDHSFHPLGFAAIRVYHPSALRRPCYRSSSVLVACVLWDLQCPDVHLDDWAISSPFDGFSHPAVALNKISPSRTLSSLFRWVPCTMSPIPLVSPIALAIYRDCMAFRQVSTDSTPAILVTLSILAPVIAPVPFRRATYYNFAISCRHCSYPLHPISAP